MQATEGGIQQRDRGETHNGPDIGRGTRHAEQDTDDQQIGKHLADQAQGNHKIVTVGSYTAEAFPQKRLDIGTVVAVTDMVHDARAGEEGQIISRIGQRTPDAIIKAQDRGIHQRTGKDPGRHL